MECQIVGFVGINKGGIIRQRRLGIHRNIQHVVVDFNGFRRLTGLSNCVSDNEGYSIAHMPHRIAAQQRNVFGGQISAITLFQNGLALQPAILFDIGRQQDQSDPWQSTVPSPHPQP